MEENLQIAMQWVYLSQAAEIFCHSKKTVADRMKTGEKENRISDDQHVWECAGVRLGGIFFFFFFFLKECH